jgi:outer membrane biosynthesis protein TonB
VHLAGHLASVLVCALAVVPTGAQAGESTSDWLVWTRGKGAVDCPSAVSLADKIAGHLQVPTPVLADFRHRMLVEVSRPDGGDWTAEVRLLDSRSSVVGVRTVTKSGTTCEAIAEAVALVAALMLANPPTSDAASETPSVPNGPPPTATGDVAPPPPRTDSVAPAPPLEKPAAKPAEKPVARPEPVVEKPPSPAEPAPVAVERLTLRAGPRAAPPTRPVRLSAGLVGGVGLLPGLGWGGEVRGSLALSSVASLFASAELWSGQSAQASTTTGADLSLWRAGLGGCSSKNIAHARSVGFCLGGAVEHLHATGWGFDTPDSPDLWGIDLGMGIELAQMLGPRAFVSFALDAVVPMVKNRVAYKDRQDTVQQVYEQAALAVFGRLRLGYSWGQ